mmetsp:Transcript_15937/g.46097  ORF Transcript_15937/g.46097 Transcript_15937/m.46097 type:complete len:448 (+) Transcript_15937:833-2176(+)
MLFCALRRHLHPRLRRRHADRKVGGDLPKRIADGTLEGTALRPDDAARPAHAQAELAEDVMVWRSRRQHKSARRVRRLGKAMSVLGAHLGDNHGTATRPAIVRLPDLVPGSVAFALAARHRAMGPRLPIFPMAIDGARLWMTVPALSVAALTLAAICIRVHLDAALARCRPAAAGCGASPPIGPVRPEAVFRARLGVALPPVHALANARAAASRLLDIGTPVGLVPSAAARRVALGVAAPWAPLAVQIAELCIALALLLCISRAQGAAMSRRCLDLARLQLPPAATLPTAITPCRPRGPLAIYGTRLRLARALLPCRLRKARSPRILRFALWLPGSALQASPASRGATEPSLPWVPNAIHRATLLVARPVLLVALSALQARATGLAQHFAFPRMGSAAARLRTPRPRSPLAICAVLALLQRSRVRTASARPNFHKGSRRGACNSKNS